MFDSLIGPFIEYGFMRKALTGGLIVSISAVPVGIFMTLRRMSLTGDAMAHAILPGAAIAYLISGLSLFGLTVGGVLAGLIVVALAGWVARSSQLKEDTSLAAFYLMSLLASISSVSVIVMAIIYRPLIIECVDSSFLRRSSNASAVAHYGFLFLMVINLVAGFHALGTLMAIGLMVLPVTAARFWGQSIDSIVSIALFVAIFGCYFGLLLSFHFDLPSGPAIIITMGFFCVVSILIGANGGLIRNRLHNRHLTG